MFTSRQPASTSTTTHGPTSRIAYLDDGDTGPLTCLEVDAPLPRKVAFVSYSRRNKKLQEEFKKFANRLDQLGRLQFWADEEIAPGTDWETELYRALHDSEAAVLLVTQDYLTSEYVQTRELPVLKDRYESQSVLVYWIPMEPSTYQDMWFAKLQALGDPQKPLSLLRKAQRQQKLAEISEALKKTLVG